MTDNEIKKAMECCANYGLLKCNKCPMRNDSKTCMYDLSKLALDLINRQQAEIDKLKEIAKKMHTWIFLNSYDEEKAYAECGLTDEENIMLGYGGKIVFEKEEIAGDVK